MSFHRSFLDFLIQQNYLFEVAQETSDALFLKISFQVKPRSHAPKIKRKEGKLIAHVQAAPVEGEANEELCGLVAGVFGLPASKVEIIKGDHSKCKVLILKYEFGPQRSYEYYQQKIKKLS